MKERAERHEILVMPAHMLEVEEQNRVIIVSCEYVEEAGRRMLAGLEHG